MYKEKKCAMEGCTNIFNPTSGNQKYCNYCKDKAKKIREKKQWRAQSRKRNNYKKQIKQCKFCGIKFTTYYQKQISCGSVTCEKLRIKLKNKIGHSKRDKRSLKIKGKKYYNNNREKCLQVKASKYREVNRDAKPYIFGRVFKHDISYISNYVAKRGYKLLSKEYINSEATLLLECPNGHKWETTFHQFRDSGNKIGSRCMTCYLQNNYVSKLEQIVRDYFEKNYPNIEIIYNDREQIKPKELDLYFPKEKLAVELCGLYWHGENSSGKPRNYHYKKMKYCEKMGIRLITIFGDEVHNQFDLVISRIKQALGITEHIIYARKCTVEEIDSKTANTFFINNHLQGKSTAKKRWGLFYNNRLVSVCSVGRVIRVHTAGKDVLELKRFCTLLDTSVVGGASKLFSIVKKFAEEGGYTSIRSYCDMRYANIFNPIYELLGFQLLMLTKYTPHYFKQNKRYRNYSLRKTPEERLTGKTEFQLRTEQGYDRIWDCGHRTYEYKI